MSLQDDYFDLRSSLKGENKRALNRIWKAFCEMEKEQDRLNEIASSMRRAVSLLFKEDGK